MNEIETKRKLVRAERASQILEDPFVKEALSGLRKTVYENIETSHFKDKDEREDLYKMLQVIRKFELQFEKMIRDGQLAKSRWEELKKKLR